MRQAFFTPFPRWFLAFGAVWCLGAALLRVATAEWIGSVLLGLGLVWGAAMMALGWRNHGRPVLRISDDAIEFGSPMSLSLKRVGTSEVSRVAESRGNRVVLEKRSGDRVAVPLRPLRKAQRAEARAAIEARFRDASG